MQKLLITIAFLTTALLFGVVSLSQSLAAAKRAQAVIETARAAQIASTGQALGTFFLGMIAMLLVVLIIGVVALVIILKLRQPTHQLPTQPRIIFLPTSPQITTEEGLTQRWLPEIEDVEVPEDEDSPLLPATWNW